LPGFREAVYSCPLTEEVQKGIKSIKEAGEVAGTVEALQLR